MAYKSKKFSIIIPAQIEKGKDGDWRIYGLASTAARDLQGEVVNPKGLDLSPIEKGRGVFNFDHKKGPENIIGAIDTAKKSDDGLFLGGYLFKKHDRAKAVHQIMSSLTKSDRGRMGMSIEGVVQQRDGEGEKTIAKAKITSCALTMNPVNTDTYVDVLKSFNEVQFDTNEVKDEVIGTIPNDDVEKTQSSNSFTAVQVVSIIKALSVGDAKATKVPTERSGGDALAQEELDQKTRKGCKKSSCKGSKSLKKLSKQMYKSAFYDLIADLKKLYPASNTSELFEVVKDRLNTKFPNLKL